MPRLIAFLREKGVNLSEDAEIHIINMKASVAVPRGQFLLLRGEITAVDTGKFD